MEAQKRLELYEKAVIDYERRAKKEDMFYSYLMECGVYGFCYYFSHYHNVRLKNLPELYKPLAECGDFYWNKHNKHPRIKALKNAIETVKKLLK